MIARRFVPALLVALPLTVGGQAPRARAYRAAADDAPYVRVWIPGASAFRYGEPVQVSFEVSEASHAAVFRVDGDGRLTVLWPQRNSLQTAARPGQEYRIFSPSSSVAAFHADYAFGGGMVIAVASYDPIDLSAFRRYRNDLSSYYRNVATQQPYIGGVRQIVDRLTQEILYSDESEYDYDVAFYNVTGAGGYTNRACSALLFGRHHYATPSYISWVTGSPYAYWDDCYSSYYSLYLLSCSSWSAVYSFGRVFCRSWDGNWPVPPVAGPQPEPPKVNITMIDSIINRPVDKYPLLDRKPEPTSPNGTTRIVTMEPSRDGPNVTRWVSDDETDAISIPHLRRNDDLRDQSRIGRVSARDEGFIRSPGTGIRVDEPGPGRAPDRTGMVTMPPVREPPRPEPVWRDTDRGTTMTPRWDRPNPSGSIDRGSTSSGSASGARSSPPPSPPPAPPAAKATETKTGTDAKAQGEKKPPQ